MHFATLHSIDHPTLQIGVNRSLMAVLEESQRLQAKEGVKEMTILHMVLSVVKDKSVWPHLKAGGFTRESFLDAVTALRQEGKANDTDLQEEAKDSVLAQFSEDLTAGARDGQFDPVIGRDKEIRRIMQVRALGWVGEWVSE